MGGDRSAISPAAARVLKMVEEQRRLAAAVDAALEQLHAARSRFEAHGLELERCANELSSVAGFRGLEYQGAERLRLWLRARGSDPGFVACERPALDRIADAIERVNDVTGVKHGA